MPAKKPWLSKTIWMNILLLVASFYPPIGNLVSNNPELLAGFFAIVNVVLRLVTKKPIVIE